MGSQPLYNEKEILLQIVQGDELAFNRLVEFYAARIYSHILSYLKSPAIAEEVVQDVFISVWKHRSELPALENFPGWLYTITRNRTRTVFRDMLEHDQFPINSELETSLQSPAEMVEYRELSIILNRGIEQLPPRRQQVFRMSRFEGKTYEEIAVTLGISRSAVNQHMVEAISFLRNWLNNELGPLALTIPFLLSLHS